MGEVCAMIGAHSLQQHLQGIILWARLEVTQLPLCPVIQLLLLNADSRVKNFDYPPYRKIARHNSFTVPDLAESAEFRDVRVYLAE
tara:strand:- start:15585 stop:15842 length:258 start_codon:yes stop_codon:yes gene_type:complete